MNAAIPSHSITRSLLWLRSAVMCIALLACGGSGSAGAGASPPAGTPAPPALPAVDVSAVPVGNTASALPANWHTGAFMEIFVRGYKDSNGDGIGDLRGLIQQLDYLKALGITGIWLMPVTASQDRDHGYAVTDYRGIETAYGSLADFDELLVQAHARGMGVVIDYVINHSAALNPIFVNSSASSANSYRNWFVWQNPAPTGWSIFGNNPWHTGGDGFYLGQFSAQMPDFNFLNPAVLEYHQNNLRFWLNRGVDGFRFDAVTHLVENGSGAWQNQPENYTLVAQLRKTVMTYSQRYLVCEATSNVAVWSSESNCGSAFAFGHQMDVVNAARGEAAAIGAVANYFASAPASLATMVSNHDLFAGDRLWNQVSGDAAQYRLAAATYLLQPGTPFIYYGEEIGMSAVNSLSGDGRLRTPMSWSADASNAGFSSVVPFRPVSSNLASNNVAAQQADPNSLLAFYKAMLNLRNTYPSIARGSYQAAFVSGSAIGFQRWLGNERTLVLLNYGNSAAAVRVDNLGANAKWNALYPAGGSAATADASASVTLTLPAQSVQVFTLAPG